MYKKKPLNFTYEQVSRKQRLAETLKTRESSRFERLSVIRSINDSAFTPTKDENSSKIEVASKQVYKPIMTSNASQKKQPVSRLDMLRKWKEEKMLKKELEAKEKKKPFYVGGNTKNAANSKNPPNSKTSFTFNSTTLSSKSNTPYSKIQPKSVIPGATQQKNPSFLPSKIPSGRQNTPLSQIQPKSVIPGATKQIKPVTKSVEAVNKGYITPTYQKKVTNTTSTGICQNKILTKPETKPMVNDKKPNTISVPSKSVKASGLQKPLNYKSQPNPVSKLPVKPVSKVVGTIPKPTPSVSKGIPDRRIQSKMPTVNANQKSTISKNLPQKMPVPIAIQKSTTSSNLPQKGQNFASGNIPRKGYCFKKAVTESRLQARNALTTNKTIDKKPEEGKPVDVKCSEVTSLPKEEISLPDVPFDSSISMIKPNSFAPTNFTFRPPILMAHFVLDDDEDNLTEVLERAKLKYMTRTSTPAKPIEESCAVQSPCSPVLKVKDSAVSTHSSTGTDESSGQLAVKKLVFDTHDPESTDKKSNESSNECEESNNVNENLVTGSFKQTVKAVADDAGYTTETADDKDRKLFNVNENLVNESFKQTVKAVADDAGYTTETADDRDEKLFNEFDEKESNIDTSGCPVSESFELLVVKDLTCDEHITERADENIKNGFNKHEDEENNAYIGSPDTAPLKDLVVVEKLVDDGSHVAKPVNEGLSLSVNDENNDDVNGTFVKESSEQLIVEEINSNEEHDAEDKNDSKLFTECIAKENNDGSSILNIDEPAEQLIVKELACDEGQALNVENTDELNNMKISDAASEKIVGKDSQRFSFGEKSFIGDENDEILIPVSPFDDSLGDLPNIQESKIEDNFQGLSLESGADIKEDTELVKLDAEVETTKAVRKKSSIAVPKRTSMFRNLSILTSVAEKEESFSKTPGKKENATPRRSKRISARFLSDSPLKERDVSETDSPGSVFTPRRSARLLKKSSGSVVSQDSCNSHLESQTSSRNTPRRSMRLIDLNTPEKESDSGKKTERLLSFDFENLNLKDGSENVDPSKFSTEFESLGEMPMKLRSKKVSLLYSPEKRKSFRKSIKGDLMSFSPSS